MEDLIKDIKAKLSIEGGTFIDAEIESYISEVNPNKYLDFFKALSGEHNFSKPMDRIANVAKRFSKAKKDELFTGTREMAKAMYNKFYAENSIMTDHTQKNRDTIPNDRAFFKSVNYVTVSRGGEKVFTPQELYVLEELGGGSWLIDIKCAASSREVTDKIENIIKTAITSKYLSNKNVAIESPAVMKMIRK